MTRTLQKNGKSRSGLPDKNKKLLPNSLQKLAKLSKNSPNFWKWLHLYQNIVFFIGNQLFKALLSFALYFTRKHIGISILQIYLNNQFRHFAKIYKRSVQYHTSTFKTFTLSFDVMNFQTTSTLRNSKSSYEYVTKYVQIYRSYISPNQKIWSQMLSINRQKFAKLPNQNILAISSQNSPELRSLAINSPIWQPCRVLFAIERRERATKDQETWLHLQPYCYSVSLWRGELSEVSRNLRVSRSPKGCYSRNALARKSEFRKNVGMMSAKGKSTSLKLGWPMHYA